MSLRGYSTSSYWVLGLCVVVWLVVMKPIWAIVVFKINSISLGLEIKIEVSILLNYREENINYITPKMFVFIVFFIIKHLYLCVKQTSLRDVLRLKTYVLLTFIKPVHIGPVSYSSVPQIYFEHYFEYFKKSNFVFSRFCCIQWNINYDKSSPKPLDLESLVCRIN